MLTLPRNHPTHDAGTCVTGRIGHVVVRECVDHQGATVGIEDASLAPPFAFTSSLRRHASLPCSQAEPAERCCQENRNDNDRV